MVFVRNFNGSSSYFPPVATLGAWVGVSSDSPEWKYAITGTATGNGGTKVGVLGSASGAGTNYAGYFTGDVYVSGTLRKGGGFFKIDDPLDPANRFLTHSFVESPEMKNVYDGVVTLDASGAAGVEMPDWFDALNRDFRYQLTCIGGFAPVYIAEEIAGNAFRVAGGEPGMKVSWQVTGVRKDAFAEHNPITVEQDKPADQVGLYLHPEAFGLSPSMSIDRAVLSGAE